MWTALSALKILQRSRAWAATSCLHFSRRQARLDTGSPALSRWYPPSLYQPWCGGQGIDDQHSRDRDARTRGPCSPRGGGLASWQSRRTGAPFVVGRIGLEVVARVTCDRWASHRRLGDTCPHAARHAGVLVQSHRGRTERLLAVPPNRTRQLVALKPFAPLP